MLAHRALVACWLTVGITSSLLGGCFRHAEVITTIRNPFVVGGVTPNEVQHLYASREQQHQLPPGSMTDLATLTRMDASAACFNVQLRAMDEGGGQTWTDIRNWDVSLLVGEVEMVEPAIELYPPQHQQYNGLSLQDVVVGQRQVCVNRNGEERDPETVTRDNPCGRWESRNITESRWMPAVLTVTTASANVCFQNQGHLSASTPRVTLKIERRIRRLDFTWEFE